VTYLTGLLQNNLVPKQFVQVIKAANASEYDHYTALKQLGAKPLTTKFWAPNAFFEKDKVFATIEAAEDLFVNAYLVGATVFAKAGNADAARYAGEIGGVGRRPRQATAEPRHRVREEGVGSREVLRVPRQAAELGAHQALAPVAAIGRSAK
jgi:hypothetical protein